MVPVGAVLPIDGVVPAGVVRALHPDLAQVAVPALALGLWVGNDDRDSWEKFARLHQRKGMWASSLDQSDSVMPEIYKFRYSDDKVCKILIYVPEGPEINIDCGGVWGGGSLQTDGDVLSAAKRG